MATTETVSLTTALVRATQLDRTTVRTIVGSVGELTVEGGGKFQVATGSTGLSLDMGGVANARVLYLASDQSILVILNGSGSIPLGYSSFDVPGFILLLNTNITSVAVTNASGNQANIDFFVAGL